MNAGSVPAGKRDPAKRHASQEDVVADAGTPWREKLL
jgi:hypothetical protein